MSKQGKAIAAVLVLVSGATAFWIADGMSTPREMVGFGLASGICMGNLVRVIGLVMSGGDQDLVRQLDEAERRSNTGTWGDVGGGPPGARTTVRFDPRDGGYYLHGWVSDFYQIKGEEVWYAVDRVRQALIEIEADGLMPDVDPATAAIRARLGIGS